MIVFSILLDQASHRSDKWNERTKGEEMMGLYIFRVLIFKSTRLISKIVLIDTKNTVSSPKREAGEVVFLSFLHTLHKIEITLHTKVTKSISFSLN